MRRRPLIRARRLAEAAGDIVWNPGVDQIRNDIGDRGQDRFDGHSLPAAVFDAQAQMDRLNRLFASASAVLPAVR